MASAEGFRKTRAAVKDPDGTSIDAVQVFTQARAVFTEAVPGGDSHSGGTPTRGRKHALWLETAEQGTELIAGQVFRQEDLSPHRLLFLTQERCVDTLAAGLGSQRRHHTPCTHRLCQFPGKRAELRSWSVSQGEHSRCPGSGLERDVRCRVARTW